MNTEPLRRLKADGGTELQTTTPNFLPLRVLCRVQNTAWCAGASLSLRHTWSLYRDSQGCCAPSQFSGLLASFGCDAGSPQPLCVPSPEKWFVCRTKEAEPMIPKFRPDSHVLHYSDSGDAHSFSSAKRYLQTPRLVFIHLVSSAQPPILVQMAVFR